MLSFPRLVMSWKLVKNLALSNLSSRLFVVSPMSGKVTDINSELADRPETINEDCYDEGWLIRVALSEPDEQDNLLTMRSTISLCSKKLVDCRLLSSYPPLFRTFLPVPVVCI